ncbi:MAG: hypothetical protein LBG27_01575 [Spirochaetaceae bacterium]|jgi:hypothetical protein|nr:hypothetical protein [Spirochaetaceae bacterium]
MEEQKKSENRFVENTPLKGTLRYTVFKNGVPVERAEEPNLIVNGARLQMARLIAGDVAQRSVNRISVGTNGAAPTVADMEITGAFTKEVAGFAYPADGQVQVNWKLLVSEANGMAIREFGLLTADGTLFARRIRANPIYKESDISIEGEWIIIF